MRHHIAYYRCVAANQSIDAMREAMGGTFDQEFADDGADGRAPATDRLGFAGMLASARSGDVVHTCGLDQLGDDAVEIDAAVRGLLDARVTLDVHGIGTIGPGKGEEVVRVLGQLAELERRNAALGQARRRDRRNRSAGTAGHPRQMLGRPFAADAAEVRDWRRSNNASIAETAGRFGISPATVKRYCARSGPLELP